MFQDAFLAEVQEYDVRPGGQIDIQMSLPADRYSRRIFLSRARVLRNELRLQANRYVIERAIQKSEACRAFLDAARSGA
jgi:hypothetical protein